MKWKQSYCEHVVQSENTKERYLEKLLDWAGEDTKDYWEKKLIVHEKSPADVNWQELASSHHAYYGSASPIVLMFSQNKKPVMIARYDIE